MKHGLRQTRLYGIWNGMLQRCYNPNRPKYKDYGARGIGVCDDWRHNFTAFYDWAMANGYNDRLTIDRINNDKDYEPSNCRWVTNAVQANNKSTSKYITYKGETKTVAEWAKEKNINTSTLWLRLFKSNWSIEKSLESPVSQSMNTKKPITQFDKHGNIIRDWDSALDAARELNLSHSGINLCCLNKRASSGGFIWKYRED